MRKPITPRTPRTLLLVIQAAVLTYVAGELVGRWLHRANDQLARFWVQLVVARVVRKPDDATETQSSTEVSPSTHSRPGPAAPMQHPMAAVAAELLELTAVELRAVLQTRRRCSKAQLVSLALAW